MNYHFFIAVGACAGAFALWFVLLSSRRRALMPPILHPGWDNLPTPASSTEPLVSQETLPGRSPLLRDNAGAPTIGTYRVVCMECGNTIQVSPIRGASIETQSICRFCAARLRMDVPGFDEPGVRHNVTPDFEH